MALSGNSALIGATGDDDEVVNAGSAYIFEQDTSGSWIEAARLFASDGAQGDEFGHSVALSEPFAIVGAPQKTNAQVTMNIGAAYIYERQADSTWIEAAILKNDESPAQADRFGNAVAISGDRALVTIPGDDDKGQNTGAVYVFERQTDGSWTRSAKLMAGDAANNDNFGYSAALLGNRILVGAALADSSGDNTGVAYVFEQQEGEWVETARLVPGDPGEQDFFGSAVALSGDRALIGASLSSGDTGKAYVFERHEDGSWTEADRLDASDTQSGDRFGAAVALLDDWAFVGTTGTASTAPGVAYVFERQEDGSWTEAAGLAAGDPTEIDEFGAALAAADGHVLIGAPNHNNGIGAEGAAYVFKRPSDDAWSEAARLTPGDTPVVLSFTLIDADTDEPVPAFDPIAEGATLALNVLPPNLNMRVNTTDEVESVVLTGSLFSNPDSYTENTLPYSVFFDQDGDYTPADLPIGDHTLTATPYTTDNPVGGSGGGLPLTLHFSVVDEETPQDSLAVTGFTLIDAEADTVLFPLQDSTILRLDLLPHGLNLRADVTDSVRHVRFNLNPGNHFYTASQPPFALFGRIGSDYLPGFFTPDTLRLTATPYPDSTALGAPGPPLSMTLIVQQGTPVGIEDAPETSADLPSEYALEANYPNPFNPSTVIGFSLPEASPVRVAVYDLLGRQVALLADGPMPAGRHEVTFDGSGLSSGLYLYRLEAAGQAFVRRMHLLK